jgi:hypothetical protein
MVWKSKVVPDPGAPIIRIGFIGPGVPIYETIKIFLKVVIHLKVVVGVGVIQFGHLEKIRMFHIVGKYYQGPLIMIIRHTRVFALFKTYNLPMLQSIKDWQSSDYILVVVDVITV